MHVTTNRLAWASCAALVAILLWDTSALDLALARAMGGASGFPLRDNWFMTTVMHSGAKYSAWLLELLLCLAVIFPLGAFGRLPFSRRIQVAATVMLASGVVSLLKAGSQTSCPWDLHEFGGIAHHVSHWIGWFESDGGAGRCFPAGHASAGFAFLGGYFACRHEVPWLARLWLAVALAAGFALGLSQQLRGAHFLSHTLWTGWICWMTAYLSDPFFVPEALPQAQAIPQ